MTQPLPEFDRTLLGVLARGAEKTFENAESLYREAQILARAGATARALCLHQISLEECSKVNSIGEWATSLLAGHKVDQNKILKALANHSFKNKTNAYMLEGPTAEKDAKDRGDWKAASEEFAKFKAEYHESSNNAKNASLYVDWSNGEFVAPADRITVQMLAEIADRNKTFLGHAYNYLQTLRRMEREPDITQSRIIEFVEMAEKMRAESPNDALTAIKVLINKFLDFERKKHRT
jgi:AbiV family abortive infection protein